MPTFHSKTRKSQDDLQQSWSGSCHPSYFLLGTTFIHRTPQALHSVLCPNGPALQTGVLVAWHCEQKVAGGTSVTISPLLGSLTSPLTQTCGTFLFTFRPPRLFFCRTDVSVLLLALTRLLLVTGSCRGCMVTFFPDFCCFNAAAFLLGPSTLSVAVRSWASPVITESCSSLS